LNQLLTRALVEFFSQYIDRALGHWPLNNGKQTGRATAAPGPAMTLQQAPDTYHAEKVTIKAWRASSASLNKRTLDNILAVYGRATPVIELDRAAGARYAESVKDRLASGQ